jgi:hypothetical protein
MIESLVYLVGGFALTLLALEFGWHLTACRMSNKTIKPCMFKQIRLPTESGNFVKDAVYRTNRIMK